MTKYFCVAMLFFYANMSKAQQIGFSKDSLQKIKVDNIFSYGTAASQLKRLIDKTNLNIKFDSSRLDSYPSTNDFLQETALYIIEKICKTTKSKYFIANNNCIYIIGKEEVPNREVSLALRMQEQQLIKRNKYEEPQKFNVTVAGKVTDVNTGEPLSNVNVKIIGRNGGTATNTDGYFTLYNVPSDTTILEFSNIGYSVSKHFLSPSKSLDSLHIQMSTLSNSLTEVVVTSKTLQTFKLNQKVSMIKMTPALISTLPSIGEKDIFRSFQLMPGVSAANENSSGLYVRGGTPDQSLVLYDGFTVYNVEHLFGFYSAFNSEAIKDATLYKGGFEPKFGGRLSSVVDINGKEGNKKKFNAGAGLNFLGANIFGEGPLSKNLTGIISYRRSFRTSLYDKIFDKYSGKNESELNTSGSGPLASGNQKTKSFFYDFNSKFTWKPTKEDVFSWSTYAGKDNLDNSIIPEIPDGFRGGTGANLRINISDVTKWGNTGSSLKWSRRWSKKLYSNTLVSYSNYFSNRDRGANINTTDANGNAIAIKRGTLEDNNLKDFSLKTDIELKANKNHSFEIGYLLTHNYIKYSYAQNDTSKIIDRATKGNTYNIYLQDKISMFENKLQIITGARTAYFDQTEKMYYEPRLNITYDVNNKIKLKGSAGKYYQFAKRVIREDVLQGSRDFWVLADSNRLPVSSSIQFVAGASWENNTWLFDIESYYKKLEGLSEYSLRYQISPRQVNYSENYFEGRGYARGFDVLLQKKFGKFTGWAAYTLGEAINNFEVYGKDNFYAANDVRHEFKVVNTYKWKKFDFSATFIYASGKPYTKPAGGYTLTLPDGGTQDIINVGPKNGSRLPAYHRFDVAATYNFGEIGKGNGTIGLSFFNVYNRNNVWYKNYEVSNNSVIETNVNYLGFTPNLSFTYKFR
jgi:ferric enterobactin receptor